MASSHITSWQIDRETRETVTDFLFLGSKITADWDCNLEIKRQLPLGRKPMTNLDSALKSKDQGIRSNHFMSNTWGNNGNSERLYFLGL